MSNNEIDILDITKRVWKRRKFMLRIMGIGIVVGLLIAISVPRQYSVNMTLSPESGKGVSKSSLAGMATMFGINNLGSDDDVDALNISLFPDIISSTPFLLELFDVQVQTKRDGTITYPLSKYLETEKEPWWSGIKRLPANIIGAVKSLFTKEVEDDNDKINPFALTKKQSDKLKKLREYITATVNKKSGITTVNVTLQNPVAAAILADTVIRKLQEYITTYRVSKATDDCAYLDKLYMERRHEYYIAQQAYSNYVDAHKSVILQSELSERERLQNETTLAYQVYSQVATQLQMARAKVQEAKPVFAVVEPATIPLKPSGTGKLTIVAGFLFLSFLIGAGWILVSDKIVTLFSHLKS